MNQIDKIKIYFSTNNTLSDDDRQYFDDFFSFLFSKNPVEFDSDHPDNHSELKERVHLIRNILSSNDDDMNLKVLKKFINENQPPKIHIISSKSHLPIDILNDMSKHDTVIKDIYEIYQIKTDQLKNQDLLSRFFKISSSSEFDLTTSKINFDHIEPYLLKKDLSFEEIISRIDHDNILDLKQHILNHSDELIFSLCVDHHYFLYQDKDICERASSWFENFVFSDMLKKNNSYNHDFFVHILTDDIKYLKEIKSYYLGEISFKQLCQKLDVSYEDELTQSIETLNREINNLYILPKYTQAIQYNDIKNIDSKHIETTLKNIEKIESYFHHKTKMYQILNEPFNGLYESDYPYFMNYFFSKKIEYNNRDILLIKNYELFLTKNNHDGHFNLYHETVHPFTSIQFTFNKNVHFDVDNENDINKLCLFFSGQIKHHQSFNEDNLVHFFKKNSNHIPDDIFKNIWSYISVSTKNKLAEIDFDIFYQDTLFFHHLNKLNFRGIQEYHKKYFGHLMNKDILNKEEIYNLSYFFSFPHQFPQVENIQEKIIQYSKSKDYKLSVYEECHDSVFNYPINIIDSPLIFLLEMAKNSLNIEDRIFECFEYMNTDDFQNLLTTLSKNVKFKNPVIFQKIFSNDHLKNVDSCIKALQEKQRSKISQIPLDFFLYKDVFREAIKIVQSKSNCQSAIPKKILQIIDSLPKENTLKSFENFIQLSDVMHHLPHHDKID